MRLIERISTVVRRFLQIILVGVMCYAVAPVLGQEVAQEQKGGRLREVRASPAGEVVVIFNEQFLNSILDAIFMLPRPLAFPISVTGHNTSSESDRRDTSSPNSCASEIALARETGGTRTAVRFRDGRIIVPVAFNGSYNAPLLGCMRFQGWAESNVSLSFDRERQVLIARIEVQEVHLSGLPSLLSDPVTGLVQNAIDARINPVEILRAEQLAAHIPITAAGGALRLRAKEVRHQIAENELRLHIFYEIARAE